MTNSTANAVGNRPEEAGVDYPADAAEFRAWFPDDAACMDYLDRLRFPDGFYCPLCGASQPVRTQSAATGATGVADASR